jgi:hypothetical protein
MTRYNRNGPPHAGHDQYWEDRDACRAEGDAQARRRVVGRRCLADETDGHGVETTLGLIGVLCRPVVTVKASMMLPGAAPAVERRSRARHETRSVPRFVRSDLAVWTLVGVAAHRLYWPHGIVVAGAVAIAARVDELTPSKHRPAARGAGCHERRLDLRNRCPCTETPADESLHRCPAWASD